MFDIDLQSRIPIYEQLYKRVVELTVKKQLRPGDKLPSVRELAKALGVNPNTVSKAFQNLERDGIIYSLAGRGSFISDKNGAAIKQNIAGQFTLAAKEAFAAGLSAEEMIDIINSINSDRGNQV
ncbi:MAG: GntR family transcriptional regulator [Oscillospiraceae bacterium]|nr:GntR family transcriptional regulator [Oscillospiraceae bacterium]